jgi:hypothetical protein
VSLTLLMLNIAMFSNLPSESILPLFPSIMGGRNASRMRLQLIDAHALIEHLHRRESTLNTLLEQNDPASEHQAEDLEEYCTYLHALIRSVNGARNIPILRVAELWYKFRDAYVDLILLPPHLLMPYLDEKIQKLHQMLVNLENEIRNPNLEYLPAELEHELAILKANHTRVHLIETILKDLNPSNALHQMTESEDRMELTRFDHRFPDFCQARLMSATQFNQSERNLLRHQD